MRNLRVLLIFFVCVLLAGCGGDGPAPVQVAAIAPAMPAGSEPESGAQAGSAPAPTPAPTPAPAEISIMAVGDIMFHGAQIAAAYDRQTRTHDFAYSFQYIKDIISSADLALGNFECTLAGPGRPYSVHASKSFSAPDTAAHALKEAGFDVLSTVNNHARDRGTSGLLRTLDVLRETGIACVGTRKNDSEPAYHIADVRGVKVGVAAYSHSSKRGQELACYFTYATIEEDLELMAQTVRAMREDGADVVIFIMHWGREYAREMNKHQIRLAQGLADAGVDIIFASHPHVLQPVDVISSDVTGRSTFVAYSLGNFISNQRSKYYDHWTYTEDAMVLHVKIVKPYGGAAVVSAVEYLPTWTMMHTTGGRRYYTVLPLDKALAAPDAYDINTPYNLGKAQKSLDNTNALLAGAVEKGHVSPWGGRG